VDVTKKAETDIPVVWGDGKRRVNRVRNKKKGGTDTNTGGGQVVWGEMGLQKPKEGRGKENEEKNGGTRGGMNVKGGTKVYGRP